MNRTRHVAALAAFLILGLALSYAERLLPLDFIAPGIRLGLANLLTIVLLYTYGAADALLVQVMRVLLSGLLFGNLFGVVYGLTGSLLAWGVMWALHRAPVSPIGVGIAGGVAHNIGQLAAAMLLTTPHLLAYLPVLLLAGTAAGLVTGLTAALLLPRLHIILRK